ncbi:MAG: aminoacyl-tRNA hydrolase [Treponema sp.]|jgi:ribosome-associated protein|nr:aminoacyl-tRNA hydrolase [Treponema sp.]
MDLFQLRQSIRIKTTLGFSRSGGPGGQNVNKVNTKVTLHLKLSSLEGLSDTELSRVRELLAGRITTGDEIVISSGEERSQHTNLERAFTRLENLIIAAARLPKYRRPTKPSRASKEKRLQTKRQHSQKKSGRTRPDDFES